MLFCLSLGMRLVSGFYKPTVSWNSTTLLLSTPLLTMATLDYITYSLYIEISGSSGVMTI